MMGRNGAGRGGGRAPGRRGGSGRLGRGARPRGVRGHVRSRGEAPLVGDCIREIKTAHLFAHRAFAQALGTGGRSRRVAFGAVDTAGVRSGAGSGEVAWLGAAGTAGRGAANCGRVAESPAAAALINRGDVGCNPQGQSEEENAVRAAGGREGETPCRAVHPRTSVLVVALHAPGRRDPTSQRGRSSLT